LLVIRAYHESAVTWPPQRLSDSYFRAWHESRQRRHGRACAWWPWLADRKVTLNLSDLSAKAQAHKNDLAPLMITVSQHARCVEKTSARFATSSTRTAARVYMDGANMNAQVGLTRRVSSARTFAI